MQTLFSRSLQDVQVSIILLDWSCRESFHIFDYLDKQTIPRDRYEIIWLEYFGTRPAEIARRIETGTAGPDIWGVLDMPQDAYYHKHFLYNAGILLARGRIVVICDSDAMVTPTFVERIVDVFARQGNVVVHLDEVRNIDHSHYPFDYPTVAELLAGTCINWRGGVTSGLLGGDVDVIHDRNYGACFCALKEDLLAVGGADEHIDYLGHICGPYDMTFRLVNSGRREIWLTDEYLYHTWHPGTDGQDNYLGPHDGRNFSSRSLNARMTGRIAPYLESPAIARYRETGDLSQSLVLMDAVAKERTVGEWRMNPAKRALCMGREAWHRGRFGEAVAHWSQLAVRPESHTSEVLGWLAWGFLSQKRLTESIDASREALRLDAANDWARCALGRALSLQGHDDESLGCFNDLLNGRPEDLLVRCTALEGRAGLLFGKMSFEDARRDFADLCQLYEQYEKGKCRRTYFRLGLCELRLGNNEEALLAFEKTGANIIDNPYLAARYLMARFFLGNAVSVLLHVLRHVKRAVTRGRKP